MSSNALPLSAPKRSNLDNGFSGFKAPMVRNLEDVKSVRRPYPNYITYETAGKPPSLLSQVLPRPTFTLDENYYPVNEFLAKHLSKDENRKFGAANFCAFLEDTVEVEQCLVIPAIASIRRLPYSLPLKAEQDLYKLVTDEGFHAEQSQLFLADLRSHFGLVRSTDHRSPLFLRRLEHQRSLEPNPICRDLITVLNGIVTETRISKELSKFAGDEFLADSVRSICRTHAEDEAIHFSQFRALGQWLWEEFDETTKTAAAGFFVDSTIARSLPDVERIAFNLYQATGWPQDECKKLVYSAYTEDVLIEEIRFAANPTFKFLRTLGVDEYVSLPLGLEQETERLRAEILERLAELEG